VRQGDTSTAQIIGPGDCSRGVLFADSPGCDEFFVSCPPPGHGVRRVQISILGGDRYGVPVDESAVRGQAL
jgi:hypothetical protein